MIEVSELSKSFAGRVALDRVTFSVERGEVVGLLGPNGAGKTTCMRILTAFVAPTAGRVRVDGCDVGSDSLGARRRIGYLPEGAPLYPELRVQEHLGFRAELRGLRRLRRREEVERLLDLCGLREVRRQLVGTLSRGYRQRLGLAEALLGDPAVLVLDEPTAGLDPNQARDARALLRSLAGERTILVSSHLLGEVEELCGRVLLLHQGKLVAEGDTRELRYGTARTTALILEVRGPGETVRERLTAIPGVAAVVVEETDERSGCTRLRLSGAIDGELCEEVARVVAGSGWGLRQLHPAVTGLDDVFAELTGYARGASR